MERFEVNKFIRWMIYIIIVCMVLFALILVKPVIVWLFSFLKAVLAPFLIALIIAYILHPVVNLLHGRKVPRTAAILLIYVVFFSSLTVIFMNVSPIFLKQLKEVNEHLPELTIKAQRWFDGIHDNKQIPEAVRSGLNQSLIRLEQFISQFIAQTIDQIGTTIGVLFTIFIVPFLAFYMLKDYRLMERSALAFVPKKHMKSTLELVRNIDQALGNYIRGQILVCVLVGLLSFVGYWLINMPYPLLLSSLVAVMNIIPYLGPFFGAAPAIIVASTLSWKMVLFVIGVNLTVQILEGNVIGPQIVGKTLQLHPLMIILALLIGGELGGIVGLLLAVPLLAVSKVVREHFS